MAKKRVKSAKRSAVSASSAQLKEVMKRLKASDLSDADKRVVSDILGQTVKLKQLVERSTSALGGKKVLVSLPFGFDIVK
jgi:hypothetical protein